MAVGGFDMSTLICLLDYIIIERVWENTGLYIVVDSIKKHRKSFAILDITKMEDFEILKSSVETSNKVVFTQLNREVIDSINTHSKDFIVISLSTFGYNFQILNLLNCPFISLSGVLPSFSSFRGIYLNSSNSWVMSVKGLETFDNNRSLRLEQESEINGQFNRFKIWKL